MPKKKNKATIVLWRSGNRVTLYVERKGKKVCELGLTRKQAISMANELDELSKLEESVD